jgi:hypothetical protein
MSKANENGDRPPRGRWTARALVVVINGMLVGVCGVFVATASIPVTVVAATAAVAISIAIVVAHR